MLELRPDCEACGRDLPPESEDALICSFECTFCRQCGLAACPNCGGNLQPRPIRPAEKLVRNPASQERRFRG